MEETTKTRKVIVVGTPTDKFDIPFDYLAKKFVKVYQEGILLEALVDYDFITTTRIQMLKGDVATGQTIEIRRETSATARLVSFRDASVLTASDLDISALQSLHLSEEARDSGLWAEYAASVVRESAEAAARDSAAAAERALATVEVVTALAADAAESVGAIAKLTAPNESLGHYTAGLHLNSRHKYFTREGVFYHSPGQEYITTGNWAVDESNVTVLGDYTLRDALESAYQGAGIIAYSPEQVYPSGSVGGALRSTSKPSILYDLTGSVGSNGQPALQAAINGTVKVDGTINRGAIELLGGGEFAIEAPVELDRKSVILAGNKALVKWRGDTASSMIRVVDSTQCHIKDLVLIGDSLAPPFAAIYGEALTPRRVKGTNEYCTLENIIVGRRFMLDTDTGGSVSTDGAGKVQNGIVIGGSYDGDNDEWRIRNVQVNGHTNVAFDFRNTQSIWSSVYDTCANNGATGYRLGCNVTMFNVTSNRQTVVDIEGIRNIEVSIFGIHAEHSNIFILSKSGASFFVRGGELQMKTTSPGNFFRWENGGSMILEDLYVENIQPGLKTIFYRPGSTKGGVIRVRNCTIQGGSLRDTWDLDTSRAVGDPPVTIDIEHGDFRFKTSKPYADRTVSPPSIAAGSSVVVATGVAATPLGEFFHAAYQYNPQGVHITPAPESSSQMRARLFNPTTGVVALPSGRMRWMNLGDHIIARGAASIDAPLMTNNTGYTASIPVPGVRLGDFVAWGAGGNYINSIVTAYVSAEDTVSLRIHNATGGNSDPAGTVLYAGKLRDFGNFQAGLRYAVPSIAQGETQAFTLNVPGAQLGGHAFVAYTKDLLGLLCTCHVSAPDTVTILLSNYTGATVSLAPGSFKVMVAF